ncbi:uncharacterized protein YwnB-like isoform X2 [Branchiostoma lanceolatum]|uniref:uncharacterized protein YwnB-like isoform X2 n=1 Tax=Branchiostoma lanceolatum TaxID=7740 RepID=UPI003454C943
MKMVIVGASGRSGTELAKQALEQGHDVTALVRNEDKMREKVPDQKLKVETVDVTSVESLTPHFKGKDAVVNALSHVGELKDTVTIFSESMKAIVPATRNANVRRLLTLSAWFTFELPLIEKENATQVSGVQGKMSRGDVARFVLATLSSDKYKGKAVAVITVQNEK